MRKLLTLRTSKMDKSAKYSHLSAVLHLEPKYKYNGKSTCPMAGKCFATCLVHSGRMRFEMNEVSRLWKTEMFAQQQKEFLTLLCADIEALVRKAKREGLTPTVRLNGTSDIAWEQVPVGDLANIMEVYPDVQFIDYTKIAERMLQPQPSNYHLTYSISEKTKPGFVDQVYKETRFNCTQVYSDTLPEYDSCGGHTVRKVISGDLNDLRHLDKRGCIVGLTYKTAYINDGKAYQPSRDSKFIRLGQENNHA